MNQKFSPTQIFRLLAVLVLLIWVFYIVRPFLLIIIWAIILAVAFFPMYKRWTGRFSEKRRQLASFLFATVIAAIMFIPSFFIVETVVGNVKLTADQIRNDELRIPQPEENVKEWPVIGEKLYTEEWQSLFRISLQNLFAGRSDGGIIEVSTRLPAGLAQKEAVNKANQVIEDFVSEFYPQLEKLIHKS